MKILILSAAVILLSNHLSGSLGIAVDEWVCGDGLRAALWPLAITLLCGLVAFLHSLKDQGTNRVVFNITTLIIFGLASIAFLTEHFLVRYFSLEIIALCIAIILFTEVRSSANKEITLASYLVLKVGDLGLIIAILILVNAAGTYLIGPAFAAAEDLGTFQRAIVMAGLLIACWVKLAAWPFHTWALPGRLVSLPSQSWFLATILPNLGLYLLYRSVPLISQEPSLQVIPLWSSAISAGMATLLAFASREMRTSLIFFGALAGSIMLHAAAGGNQEFVWWGLIVLPPLRLALFFASDSVTRFQSKTRKRLAAIMFITGGLSLALFIQLLSIGGMRSEVSPMIWIIPQITVAVLGIWTLVKTRDLLEGKLDRSIENAERSKEDRPFARFIQWVSMEKVFALFGQGIFWITRAFQRWHTGRLRNNLVWVVSSLAVVLILLLGFSR